MFWPTLWKWPLWKILQMWSAAGCRWPGWDVQWRAMIRENRRLERRAGCSWEWDYLPSQLEDPCTSQKWLVLELWWPWRTEQWSLEQAPVDLHKPEMTQLFGGSRFAPGWHTYHLDISHTVSYLLAKCDKTLYDVINI